MTDDKAIELIQEISRLSSVVEGMNYRLFGNGQPGIIDKFHSRIKDLEDSKQQAKGVAWVMGVFVSFLSVLEGIHIFRKGS